MSDGLTYQFYVDEYHGRLAEAAFESELAYAQAFVGYLTLPTAGDLDDDQQRAYLLATCAAIDVFAENGHTTAAGFTIGSFRMDGPAEGDSQTLAARAVIPFLVPAGLLWQGVR